MARPSIVTPKDPFIRFLPVYKRGLQTGYGSLIAHLDTIVYILKQAWIVSFQYKNMQILLAVSLVGWLAHATATPIPEGKDLNRRCNGKARVCRVPGTIGLEETNF